MSFSRLGNQQKSRLVRQSILFILGGAAIIALFIFGLLPFYTRLLIGNEAQNKLPTATPVVSIPSPTLFQPFTATNSAQIAIKGSAAPNINVVLGINGSIDLKTSADNSGNFSFDSVTLIKGDNLIIAYAEDNSGNRSNGSPSITITYSTDAPKLDVSAPLDGSLVTQRKQSVVAVTGQTDPGAKVYLNDQFLFVTDTGAFSGSFQLQEGDNTLHFRSDNTAGNEAVKDVHVRYLP